MEESYAAQKLKRKRDLYRFYFFLLGIGLAFFFVLFDWLILAYGKNLDSQGRIWFVVASIFVYLLLVVLLEWFLYLLLNRKFRLFYRHLLREEAMLEGLSIFDIRVQQKDLSFLEKMLGISKLKVEAGWTQTSADAYFEINNCTYVKKEQCVIIKTKLETMIPGWIQLRNDSRKGLFEYQSKKVKQYGIGSSLEVKEYALYTTFGNDIYQLFDEESASAFYDFAKFVSCPVAITWVEDDFYVFLDGWKWNLDHDLRSLESKWIIDAQIETIKTLQMYIEKMTTFINVRRISHGKTNRGDDSSGW